MPGCRSQEGWDVDKDSDFYYIMVGDGKKAWSMAIAKDFADGDMGDLDWNYLMRQAIERLRR